jgi:hypothetical protein
MRVMVSLFLVSVFSLGIVLLFYGCFVFVYLVAFHANAELLCCREFS